MGRWLWCLDAVMVNCPASTQTQVIDDAKQVQLGPNSKHRRMGGSAAD